MTARAGAALSRRTKQNNKQELSKRFTASLLVKSVLSARKIGLL